MSVSFLTCHVHADRGYNMTLLAAICMHWIKNNTEPSETSSKEKQTWRNLEVDHLTVTSTLMIPKWHLIRVQERHVRHARDDVWTTHLLSGLRFSTAVWVWLVVSTDTSSPLGPLVVDTTSYSDHRNTDYTLISLLPGESDSSEDTQLVYY